MKILFSPSEAKAHGGIQRNFDRSSFLFPHLYDKRKEALTKYQNYINKADYAQLIKLFGTKKEDLISRFKDNIFDKKGMKAVKRYTGVAFEYLQYSQLHQKEQHYIDSNVIIFSNLFGPILAGDCGIPEYKLKQGEKIGELALENYYRDFFTNALDEYLQEEEIIDLRAGFYQKFYTIKRPYITMKFIKDKKVVSHWAKAYRGIILKQMAKKKIESISELMAMEIDNLNIQEIKEQKNKKEIVFNIVS